MYYRNTLQINLNGGLTMNKYILYDDIDNKFLAIIESEANEKTFDKAISILSNYRFNDKLYDIDIIVLIDILNKELKKYTKEIILEQNFIKKYI
jgi:hypothetical protein